jgi:hypothetical protein
LTALEQLVAVLHRVSGELHGLATRAEHLRGELAKGGPLAPVMHGEERPLIITRMTELVDELTAAALAVRRAEAHQLQSEGASQQEVADLFGVTRQRVAALLAQPRPNTEVRRPHRPRPRGTAP